MKKKVFISFTEDDRSKMQLLKNFILESKALIPVVVEDQRKGALYLSNLVSQNISEADYFIPIVTKNSQKSQWVNQEIGFAYAMRNKIEIFPIVDKGLINELKGFINNQMQLSYNFESNISVQKEQASFRKCYVELVNDLDLKNSIIDIDDSAYAEFINEIPKGSYVVSDDKSWLVLRNIRYLLVDKKTIDRVFQILNNRDTSVMATREMLKIKEGQNIISKHGPLINALQAWGDTKKKDNRLW